MNNTHEKSSYLRPSRRKHSRNSYNSLQSISSQQFSLPQSEIIHRHSQSSGNNQPIIIPHRRSNNSYTDASIDSARTSILISQYTHERRWSDQSQYVKEPSFLTVVQTAISNLRAQQMPGLQNLISAIAELQIKDSKFAPALFSEAMRIYRQSYPDDHGPLFS